MTPVRLRYLGAGVAAAVAAVYLLIGFGAITVVEGQATAGAAPVLIAAVLFIALAVLLVGAASQRGRRVLPFWDIRPSRCEVARAVLAVSGWPCEEMDALVSPTHLPTAPARPKAGRLCPLSLRVDQLACMLNFEIADHPVYHGGELQWFDNEIHGTGMLAFLSVRADRRVDYYAQRGLRIDRAGYEIGAGTRSWTEIDFDVARLELGDDGVDAEVRFTDVEGRLVEIRVDDRDGRPRRRAGLLAPVGAGIERPTNLLLVWMPGFDLVRVTDTPPFIRIDGRDVTTGRLPGARVHRRHLIKYAAPVVTAELNRAHDGPLPSSGTGERVEIDGAGRLAALTAEQAGHRARLVLDPGLPDAASLRVGGAEAGRWHVEVDVSD